MYSWSPNCPTLLSSTVLMQSLSWATTATTALRMPTPFPSPAPEELASQATRWPFRVSSDPTTEFMMPAAAETMGSWEFDVRSKELRYLSDRYKRRV